MAVIIPRHFYKELVQNNRTFIKQGDVRILWGLVTYPKGYWKEELERWDICQVCGDLKQTPQHGYFKLKDL